MDAEAYLAECAHLVDRHLDALLPPSDEPPGHLHQAMRHLVFPGGKRLRPAFAFAGAEAVGAPRALALPVAAAVELVHTYSLIHDDLPCMDDDSERRGRPAVHVAFGQAVAVLAGDALLAAAFAALAHDVTPDRSKRLLAVVRDLAEAAGSRELVGGQVDDLRFEPSVGDASRIESIHRRKAAALIAASVLGGARIAGASSGTLACLERFGERIGIAFQIADDLLDRDSGEACSLPRVLGVERARARAEELLEQGLEAIEAIGPPAEPLRELARYAVRRKR